MEAICIFEFTKMYAVLPKSNVFLLEEKLSQDSDERMQYVNIAFFVQCPILRNQH